MTEHEKQVVMDPELLKDGGEEGYYEEGYYEEVTMKKVMKKVMKKPVKTLRMKSLVEHYTRLPIGICCKESKFQELEHHG